MASIGMSRADGSGEARKRQEVVNIKEIRLTPKIQTHDFHVKVRQALKFLDGGDKVKLLWGRGREIVHADLGRSLLMELLRGR